MPEENDLAIPHAHQAFKRLIAERVMGWKEEGIYWRGPNPLEYVNRLDFTPLENWESAGAVYEKLMHLVATRASGVEIQLNAMGKQPVAGASVGPMAGMFYLSFTRVEGPFQYAVFSLSPMYVICIAALCICQVPDEDWWSILANTGAWFAMNCVFPNRRISKRSSADGDWSFDSISAPPTVDGIDEAKARFFG